MWDAKNLSSTDQKHHGKSGLFKTYLFMAASNSPVMVQMLVVLQHSLLLVKENVSAKPRLKFRHSQCEVCQKKKLLWRKTYGNHQDQTVEGHCTRNESYSVKFIHLSPTTPDDNQTNDDTESA